MEAQTEWENPVKKLLREGKPVVGATITVASPDVAAHAANMGFDFLWIEMEHSPITLETLRNMILATRGLKAMPITRVPVNELWTAKRVLDQGSLGVIFPFTSTPELARQAVAACRYGPEGGRGFGPGLAMFRWPAPEGYPQFADKNVMVIIIIEQARAIENIGQIASTPGIDVMFIGVNDLSYSLGVGGQLDHPKEQEAIAKVLAAAKRHNIPVGRPAGSPEEVQRYVKEGFQFFQAASELGLMAAGARPLLQSLGKSGIDPRKQPLY
ncbi:MAG: aldolase [Acidobacteria bacterium]|nr:aldolase [Acidobacteriota bacterium]